MSLRKTEQYCGEFGGRRSEVVGGRALAQCIVGRACRLYKAGSNATSGFRLWSSTGAELKKTCGVQLQTQYAILIDSRLEHGGRRSVGGRRWSEVGGWRSEVDLAVLRVYLYFYRLFYVNIRRTCIS
jgi:hypothetical protein